MEDGREIPRATEEDYKRLQGGRPTVTKRDGITTFTHDYPGGEGMEVESHKEYGTVIITTPDGPRAFNVDELKMFHGDPCEASSRKIGGKGYPRKK